MKTKLKLANSVALVAFISTAAQVRAQEQDGRATQAGEGTTAEAPQQTAVDETEIKEIVVTANRREQSLQRVPALVTALTGEELTNQNIVEITDITKSVPSLQVNESFGYSNMSMRGVFSTVSNSFGDPAIAVNIDQVNLARATAFRGLFYDLERIEVLKGPQGTLYGRNATGGALNVISNSPEIGNFGGYINAAFGNYNAFNTDGAINVPISDMVAARVAFQTAYHKGYLSDGSADEDRQSARVSLKLAPNDDLTIVVRGDYTHEGGKGGGSVILNRDGTYFAGERTAVVDSFPEAIPVFAPAGCPFGSLQPCVVLPRNNYVNNHFKGLSGTADWDLLGGTATFVAGYRVDKLDFITHGGAFLFQEDNKAKQFSTEARFASDASKKLSYILGAYYIDTKQTGVADYDGQFAGLMPAYVIDVDGNSWAAFGQINFSVTDALRLSAGLRYTKETKNIDSYEDLLPYYVIGVDARPPRGPAEIVTVDSRKFNATNYRVGVEWDVAPSSMAYANVSTGFKSGGFFVNNASDSIGNTYEPEKVTAYTAGVKNRFLGNRLQLNVEAFYLDYTDQQVASQSLNDAGLIVFPQYNVGKSEIKGVEVDATVRATQWTRIIFNGQYIDAKYTEFTFTKALSNFAPPEAQTGCVPFNPVPIDFQFTQYQLNCSGKTSLQTPKWAFTASLEHTIPLSNGAELTGTVRTFYQTKRYTQSTYLPFTLAEGGHRTSLNLTYDADTWLVSAYVENLEDHDNRDLAAEAAGSLLLPYAILSRPRTYGVRVGARF